MRGVLKKKLGGLTSRAYNAQSIFPSITFVCKANVTKWIIGGATFNNRDCARSVELQLWRLNPNTSVEYQRVYTSGELEVVNATIASRAFEYPVDPPLTVQPGDMLGIYLPTKNITSVTINYERDVGAEALFQFTSTSQDEFPAPAVHVVTHHHLPMVTVEIGA